MVFSCGCLAIMTLYIITDSINSWCERAPLINTELINCAAYTGSVAQNCLELCSAAGWKCLIQLIPGLFPQNFPSNLMLKREQHELPGWVGSECRSRRSVALMLRQTLAVSLCHLGFLSPSWRRWKQALGGVLERRNIKGSCNNDFCQVNPVGLLRKLGISVIVQLYSSALG